MQVLCATKIAKTKIVLKEHLQVQHQNKTGNLCELNHGSISYFSQSVGSKKSVKSPEASGVGQVAV